MDLASLFERNPPKFVGLDKKCPNHFTDSARKMVQEMVVSNTFQTRFLFAEILGIGWDVFFYIFSQGYLKSFCLHQLYEVPSVDGRPGMYKTL